MSLIHLSWKYWVFKQCPLIPEAGGVYIIAVYRRPQQYLPTFLSLIGDYLANLPQIVPTIIVGDFNEDISRANSSRLLQLMTSRGFSQLVQVPTTDSGSLLDHIYLNGIIVNSFVEMSSTHTTRTMMPLIYHSKYSTYQVYNICSNNIIIASL